MDTARLRSPQRTDPVHVLVGESSPLIRVGLRGAVLTGGWAAVTLTENCTQLRAAVDSEVQLIVVGADIECCRGNAHHRVCITELAGWARVAVLATAYTKHLGLVALDSGASTLVQVQDDPDELREQLWLAALGLSDPPGPGRIVPRLAPRERRLIALYAQGHTLAECATTMHVGVETARTHLQRIRAKYAAAGRPAPGRAELLLRAIEDGYLGWPVEALAGPEGRRRSANT